MALARLEMDPPPLESSTCSGMILFPQLTPATPNALLLTAAAVPAVAVPWPELPPLSCVSEVPLIKLQPVTKLPARSGCVQSAPVSMKAITTLEAPVVRSQAAGVWIALRCHCEEK